MAHTTPVAGEVHRIPRELSLAGDPENRRHVLLHDCDDHEDETASVAYGSLERTQHDFGAACVIIPARPADIADGDVANGFTDDTYVYPACLVPITVDVIQNRPLGALSSTELDELHALLPAALGIGSGTCWSRPRATEYVSPSCRGSVVAFGPELQDALRGDRDAPYCTHGIVLTRHELSRHRHAYQCIVPILAGVEPLTSDELDLPTAPWMAALGERVTGALVLVPETFYVHPTALQYLARPLVLPPETMELIEATLMKRLRKRGATGADAASVLHRTGTACGVVGSDTSADSANLGPRP